MTPIIFHSDASAQCIQQYKEEPPFFEYYNDFTNKSWPTLAECNADGHAGDSSTVAPMPDPQNPETVVVNTNPNETLVKCQQEAEGLTMKWIMCPVLAGLENATNGLSNMISGQLEVKEKFYKAGSGTYSAWEEILKYSNILMAIVFLFIIYSQITGHGIDNYGIKKMLPRLIVMAILVNLSFLICQLAIDLSNIFGNGLKDLFGNINIPNTRYASTESFVSIVVGGAIGAAAAGGAALSSVGILITGAASWPLVIITLVIALIGVLIAVFIFFAMIGIRTLIIIGCLILVPIAFVSYILPNTQWFFKKWWNIFKTSLIIYPICGAVMGISTLFRKIVLVPPDDGSGIAFGLLLILFFAPFLPFVFLPTLLMNAISTLGAVGGAIASMGRSFQRAGRNVQDGLRNSDMMKGLQADASRRNTIRRAGYRVDSKTGMAAKDSDGKLISRRSSIFSNMRGAGIIKAQARSKMLGDAESALSEQEYLHGGRVESGLAGIESKMIDRQTSDKEAMLNSGKVQLESGATVNVQNMSDMGTFLAQAIQRASAAKEGSAERADALAEVRAAQNIMSKTDGGRSAVQNAYENAVARGTDQSVLSSGASHIMSNFADKYKAVNRGSHAMMSDLASGTPAATVGENISNGIYDMAGTDKYTPESLANADIQALKRLSNGVANGTIKEGSTEYNNLMSTASQALQNANEGKLNMQPQVREILTSMTSGSGVVQAPAPAAASTQANQNSSSNQMGGAGTSFGGPNSTSLKIDHSTQRRGIDGLSQPVKPNNPPKP